MSLFSDVQQAPPDAILGLTEQFKAENPGVDVVFNFAGSQQLAQQLGQGAPADLFASANSAQMQAAIDVGRIISGTQQTFAGNRLVVVLPADNPAGIAAQHFGRCVEVSDVALQRHRQQCDGDGSRGDHQQHHQQPSLAGRVHRDVSVLPARALRRRASCSDARRARAMANFGASQSHSSITANTA